LPLILPSSTNSPVNPFPFFAFVPTMPVPDCVSEMVLFVVPFNPVCCTCHMPVTLGGAACAGGLDNATTAVPSNRETMKRFAAIEPIAKPLLLTLVERETGRFLPRREQLERCEGWRCTCACTVGAQVANR